jgi:hypothetical protein
MRVSGWMMMMQLFEVWGISLHETIINSQFHICWADKSSDFWTWILLTHTWRRKISTVRVAWSSRWIFPYAQTKKKIWYHESCVILKLDHKWWRKFDSMRVLWFSNRILPCTWTKKKRIKSGTMSVLGGCSLKVLFLTLDALLVFNPFFTHAPKWVHLAFQTFRASKSLHVDILEEGLLDSPPQVRGTIHTQDLLRTEMQDLSCLRDWAGDIK